MKTYGVHSNINNPYNPTQLPNISSPCLQTAKNKKLTTSYVKCSLHQNPCRQSRGCNTTSSPAPSTDHILQLPSMQQSYFLCIYPLLSVFPICFCYNLFRGGGSIEIKYFRLKKIPFSSPLLLIRKLHLPPLFFLLLLNMAYLLK